MSSSATTITYEQVEYKPNKKRYLVLDGDVLEYVIKVKTHKKTGTRVYKLFHSDSEGWLEATKGTLAFTMYDTGDDVTFKIPNKKCTLSNLQYHELFYIRLLSRLHESVSSSITERLRVVEDGGDVIICSQL